MNGRGIVNHVLWFCTISVLLARATAGADGVFVRFQLVEPATTNWCVQLGGYIHNGEPWYLPATNWPTARVAPGQFSPWFDLGTYAGKRLHGRLNKAGGVAEFPNVTAKFVGGGPTNLPRHAVIELATAPDAAEVVKRFEETLAGNQTSFLVSPTLRVDADALESASQMTARRLAWARAASGGRRIAPTNLWVQTSFWAPQSPELNLQEAEVLWLLGFNLIGNMMPEVREKFAFNEPGGHHWVEFGPALTRADIEKQIAKPAEKVKAAAQPAPYGFSDEIVCRPGIGTNAAALVQFHAWLKERGLPAYDPVESPVELRGRPERNRAFYWTTRFRQESATQRLKWLTESFHQHAPTNVLTSTLVADHPYFGGAGLGMGMERENTTWGGYPLSLDWFSLAREHVVDVIGVEDWLGLNFMYGPESTWDGFQLLGFQATIFRSGSRGELPIITWVTPSDETNLRLKTASALCQGSKHFCYWTYGPTATSTENYWSDLRSAYDGIVAITRQLAGAEHIIAPGRPRSTRVAMLYSLSSDLWQPFGYVSMAERRLTYFSLIHDQYLVDFLTEHDVEAGRLRDYDVLYVTDPCVSTAACGAIRQWVHRGGWLYGSCAAATRNGFNEEQTGLADVFGIDPRVAVEVQPGRFDLRGALNELPWLDQIRPGFGALGVKVKFTPTTGAVTGRFVDDSPAVVTNCFGKGGALFVATCPAVSYAKDAHFVRAELKEQWPVSQRQFINSIARASGAPRLVELSHPVVEAGVYESPRGVALVLANFTYQPIPRLEIRLPVKRAPHHVRSLEKGPLPFKLERSTVVCSVELGLNDILLFE
jgi:hypothetical protein